MVNPYLKHLNTEAWFQPLTLLAHVPASASQADSETSVAALMQENVHYLQSVTTFFGIYRFLTMWQSLTFYSQQRKTLSPGGEFGDEELNALRLEHESNLRKLDVFRPTESADVPPDGFDLADGAASEGPIGVEMPDNAIHGVYSEKLANGDHRLFFLDVDVLQESMPMALERWFGFAEDTYNIARKTVDPRGFKYAAGAETVRALTGWGESDSVWWVTYVLCDYALHTLTPNHVFFRGAQLIAKEWPDAPPVDALEDVYAMLRDTFEFEEVDEARRNIFRHVTERLKSLEGADDPFDRSVASLLQVMDRAIEERKRTPAYFAAMQLRDPGNAQFVQNYHGPTMSTQQGISFTSKSKERSEAILFLISAYHRLLTLIDDDHPKPCPFVEHKVCGFDRTEACHSEPWNRMQETSGNVCIYRFVDHGFEADPLGS